MNELSLMTHVSSTEQACNLTLLFLVYLEICHILCL